MASFRKEAAATILAALAIAHNPGQYSRGWEGMADDAVRASDKLIAALKKAPPTTEPKPGKP
jgi:hypothetical protein